MKKCIVILFALALGITPASAQTDSNGTGGGDWSTDSTWVGDAVPTGNFNILAGDTVTSDGVGPYAPAQLRPSIVGTWNLNNGSSYAVDRMNNDNPAAGGIINVNNSTLTVARFQGAGYTVNVNNGGSVTKNESGNGATVNIKTGGTYTTGPNGTITPRNLLGGTMINLNSTIFYSSGSEVSPASWDTGTFVINTTSLSNPGDTELGSRLSFNAANRLQLSDQESKQTVYLGRTASALNFTAAAGIMEFHMYSGTDNDNDQMSYHEAGGDFNIGSNVVLRLEDFEPLTGTTSDYLGSSYQLFNDSIDYADITPEIDEVIWNIGGADYNVSFTDSLATDGTLTVSLLAPVIPVPTDPATLQIGMNSPGVIAISWDPNMLGYTLQERSDLLSSNWADSASSSTNHPILIPATAPSMFYRVIIAP